MRFLVKIIIYTHFVFQEDCGNVQIMNCDSSSSENEWSDDSSSDEPSESEPMFATSESEDLNLSPLSDSESFLSPDECSSSTSDIFSAQP